MQERAELFVIPMECLIREHSDIKILHAHAEEIRRVGIIEWGQAKARWDVRTKSFFDRNSNALFVPRGEMRRVRNCHAWNTFMYVYLEHKTCSSTS
jgi:hypothetical protein